MLSCLSMFLDCEVSSTSNSKESNETRNVSLILTPTSLPNTESSLNSKKKNTIDGNSENILIICILCFEI